MRYVIAYDIAHPRRLRRVAKRLEQSAVRVQKSVFILSGSRSDLDAVKGDLMTLIDVAEDRLQAWPVHGGRGIVGFIEGMAIPGTAVCVVLTADGITYVEEPA
jgi:CRISPR-associated endonuclease Cas2